MRRLRTAALAASLTASLTASLLSLLSLLSPTLVRAQVITGAGAGGEPRVNVHDGLTGIGTRSFLAYVPSIAAGVRVASGDVTGDGVPDIVTVLGPGTPGGEVKVFDGVTGVQVRDFFSFLPSITTGAFVAAGDVTGDGVADIIASLDAGGVPEVKVYDGVTNIQIRDFLAYPASFAGGVRVAAGDVNGDGIDDIITATGPGSPGGVVSVFDGVTNVQFRTFSAFDPSFTGGAFVAAGDVDGDGRADIVVGADAGGAPQVRVFGGASGTEIRSFLAFAPGFAGGVRVGASFVNGDVFADILVGAGPGGPPRVGVVDGQSLNVLRSFDAFAPGVTGGVYVAGAGTAAPQLVPEPTSGALVLLGGLVLALGRSGKRGRPTGGGAPGTAPSRAPTSTHPVPSV